MTEQKHRVIFQPMGVRAKVPEGVSLRSAARSLGVAIDSVCGERATCGRCKVIIQRGHFAKENITSSLDHLSPPDEGERDYWRRRRKGLRAQGEDPDAFRLSCQARVHGDVVVMVPESSQAVQQVVRKAAGARTVDVRPTLRKLYVELEEATLEQPQADWERLKAALLAADPLTRGPHHLPLDESAMTIDLPALRHLSQAVRDGDWRLTATVRNRGEVLRVEPGYEETLVGLAVDIGTTTIAAHLCDLHGGEVLATAATMNPQVSYGEDIMSRMSHAAEDDENLQALQSAVLNALNKLARRAARQAAMRATEIMELVVVGNTAMHHLFLGLDTRPLSRAPYVPTLHSDLTLRARDVGLTAVNAAAYVHLLPITASFVGADSMAVLLAEMPHKQDENWLIVDVGTNAELVLGNRERLVCTSTPTGPAFEGAHVEYGIRATEGAIERVQIDPDTLIPRFKVVGCPHWSDEPGAELPPVRGICGSGIIDGVAELYRVGLIGSDGLFRDGASSPHLRRGEDGVYGASGPYFVLAEAEQTTSGRAIPITQEDVRQIQLAKAPLYVAAHYLLHQLGLQRPDRILLAGGFGSHIDPVKAMLIGMIPDCPLERVHAVGNAAGDGAWLALVDRERRAEAREILNTIQRIELPAQSGFQDQFMLALHFPHMVDPYPHLEGIAPHREVDPMAGRLFGDHLPQFGS
ncbi:MAG: ASKHA domain-containing protein [Chloroflexota bacterium]